MTSEQMDLRSFVADVLKEISLGIQDAQKATHELGGAVSPTRSKILTPGGTTTGPDRNVAHLVAFDVALTAVQGGDSKWGVGVVAGLLGAGVRESDMKQNATVSRVQFSVPIIYPSEYVKRGGADAQSEASP